MLLSVLLFSHVVKLLKPEPERGGTSENFTFYHCATRCDYLSVQHYTLVYYYCYYYNTNGRN